MDDYGRIQEIHAILNRWSGPGREGTLLTDAEALAEIRTVAASGGIGAPSRIVYECCKCGERSSSWPCPLGCAPQVVPSTTEDDGGACDE